MQKLGNWGFKYVGEQDRALKLYPGGNSYSKVKRESTTFFAFCSFQIPNGKS